MENLSRELPNTSGATVRACKNCDGTGWQPGDPDVCSNIECAECGATVRADTDVLGESPLLIVEALNTMPSRISFINWAKNRGLDVSEVPDNWNDRRFKSDSIETAWIGWFNALNEINPVDHNIVALSGGAAVRGEPVAGTAEQLVARIYDAIGHAESNDHRLEAQFGQRKGPPAVRSDDLRAHIKGWQSDGVAASVSARAADAPSEPSLRYTEPTEIVAYLHQVISGDGEPDQALSFAPDNFPLRDAPGFRFRSLSHRPLCFADVDHSSKPIDKSRAADALSKPSGENDLLEVARCLCSIAARRRELTNSQRANYPHVDEEGSPVLDAARAACLARGYTEEGLSVEGVAYPRATDALDSQPTDRIAELEAQLAECVALSQKWAQSAGFSDGQLYNAREVLRLALLANDMSNFMAQMPDGHWSHKARFILSQDSSQPTDGEVRNG